MGIGGMELMLIIIIAMLVIGPARTTIYARKVGKWLRILKAYVSSMTDEIKDTVAEPLSELAQPMREITKPFEELTKDVNTAVQSASKPLDDLSRQVDKSVREINSAAQRGAPKQQAETSASGSEPDMLEMAQPADDLEDAILDSQADIEDAGVTGSKS